ncbi:MAG TPA: acyl-CoA dehydrogenase family protein [Actinomycetes bacterium]|nr:acyl-CoA dehydrogenase family protein [Actinomycetes bacterium]
MPSVERRWTTDTGDDLLAMVRELCANELAPNAADAESASEFPREVFRTLGRSGLLGLPFSAEYGGGGLAFHDYLQVLEEIATAWGTVALGVSVHTLSCFPLATYGSTEQQRHWLPEMLAGDQLGAYCLSEVDAGSDAAALTTSAERSGDEFIVNGTKAWITHGGVADFYALMARTGDVGARGISCLLVPAETDGLSAATPERKLGFTASPTAQVRFDNVHVPVERRLGADGQGFEIAMAALDAGRLGIAACAVGIAQAALDLAVDHAKHREQFGRPVAQFQGLSFMLADMATNVVAARELYLAAARRKDAGLEFSTQASMAKLFATDMAMAVTTDAVQVLGGSGYVRDFPAERYFREAKALQIVEGTNQIQRMVIGRALTQP